MKTLIVYDSVYGNTEKIAQAVGQALGNALGPQEDVVVLKVSEASLEHFRGLKCFILGSPTQRFHATTTIDDLLKRIPPDALQGVKVTAFDTRLTKSNIEQTPVLAFFVRLAGTSAYAARRMGDGLKKKGGELVAVPEGFYVEGMEGPLVEGELERAAGWARQIGAKVK